jgi:hypothetical protein
MDLKDGASMVISSTRHELWDKDDSEIIQDPDR